MEKLQSPSAALVEKSKKFSSESSEHVRSELILMQKKYKRLEQKEKRMQVQTRQPALFSLSLVVCHLYC